MSKNHSTDLGTKPISKLIISQSVPAAIGILVMSLNLIIDTIFVGNYIGSTAIAVITVVLPIVFLVASFGMAIGVGGSSIISRAFGAGDDEKAQNTFGTQIILAAGIAILFAALGLIFEEQALHLFGAQGDVFEPSLVFYKILMCGVPLLAMVMAGNPVIRAEGKPTFSMTALIIPALANVLLDYVFIVVFDFGLKGAAWATVISYLASFLFILWFFTSKHSELQFRLKCLRLNWGIAKEIAALGGVTLARQGVVSLLAIVLNNSLNHHGGAQSLAVYGIISRLLMFALFPILGISQGFMPISGYNYGAKNYPRVRETVNKSILYATGVALIVFAVIMAFPTAIVSIFNQDPEILAQTPDALRTVFAVTPLIAIQLIGSAYFQSIGKARPALFLTLTKQGFFLIPLILILPSYFGLWGIWIAFPIADLLSTAITGFFLHKEVRVYFTQSQTVEPAT